MFYISRFHIFEYYVHKFIISLIYKFKFTYYQYLIYLIKLLKHVEYTLVNVSLLKCLQYITSN